MEEDIWPSRGQKNVQSQGRPNVVGKPSSPEVIKFFGTIEAGKIGEIIGIGARVPVATMFKRNGRKQKASTLLDGNIHGRTGGPGRNKTLTTREPNDEEDKTQNWREGPIEKWALPRIRKGGGQRDRGDPMERQMRPKNQKLFSQHQTKRPGGGGTSKRSDSTPIAEKSEPGGSVSFESVGQVISRKILSGFVERRHPLLPLEKN